MSQNTKQYELAVILDPSVDDRKVAPTLEKFLAVVPKEGGTVDNVDIWGRRQLAYPIKKQKEGVYAFIRFSSTPDTINEVDRLLRLSDSVLRTKVLRAEEAHVVLRQPRKAS